MNIRSGIFFSRAMFYLFCIICLICIVQSLDDDSRILQQKLSHHRVKRVIGGTESEEGQWPWLVSLQGKIPERTLFGIPLSHHRLYCGSALLNDRWLLTAAHCFPSEKFGSKALNPRYWHARIGEIALKRTTLERVSDIVGKVFQRSELRQYHVHAQRIFIHPQYNSQELWQNDIALIELEERVPDSAIDHPHIQSITLINANNLTFPADGQECIMKGWGCVANKGAVSGSARQVAIPKVSDGQCERLWGVDRATRLCAGYTTSDRNHGICSGDSGGPLVCRSGEKWIQVGVASFTSASRPENVPGVFTRVSAYRTWIDSVINGN